MSDFFTGVQFRSMHSGIHQVAIFSASITAESLYCYMEEFENLPESDVFPELDNASNFCEIIEIDYRNPPDLYQDESLRIINADGYIKFPYIPDVYNY